MNQLNSLIIEGNVVRAPELREPKAGFKVCAIQLAVNRFYRNARGEGVNEVSYFTIETYGKMAEICQQKCSKGRGLRIVGRLKQERWVKADGRTTSRVIIIAEHIEFKKLAAKPTSSADMQAMAEANMSSAGQDVDLESFEEEEAVAVF